jgi:TPR repeat protein
MPRPLRLAVILALAAIGCHEPDSGEDPPPVSDPTRPPAMPPALSLPSPDPCGDRTPADCRLLGESHDFSVQDGFGPSFNPVLALRIEEAACLHGDARACDEAGARHSHRDENVVNAPIDDRPDCSGKEGENCQVVHDYPRATALFEHGCDLGLEYACTSAGDLWMKAYGYMRQDRPRAEAFFRRACDAGHAQGCYSLGRMHWDGELGRKNPAAAMPFLEKACSLEDFEACSDVAYAYSAGHGVREDAARAFKLYQGLCEGHSSAACLRLAEFYRDGRGTPRDPEKAIALFQEDCEHSGFLESGYGCLLLGRMYQRGQGIPRDPAKARALFDKACGMRDGEACWMTRWLGGWPSDR